MTSTKAFILSLVLFFITHVIVWFQVNGQFMFKWFKDNPLLVSLIGVPISYGYIYAVSYGFEAFDNKLWPGRFLGFAVGMVVFGILTGVFLKEGINTKTAVSLVLATALVCIQIFWKS